MQVLIDANAIGFAAHNSAKLKAGDLQTQAVFGFLRTLRAMSVQFFDAKLTVLWDGRSWRKDVYEGYKASRDATVKMAAMRDDYKVQRPYISRAVRALGVTQIMALNLEADDLAAILTKFYAEQSQSVILITGDKDWLQLVRPGVIWHDPIRKWSCNHRIFREFTGYENGEKFLQAKALQGDSSDEIPGVGGIGEKAAAAIIGHYGSVEAMFEDLGYADAVPAPLKGWKKKVLTFAADGSEGRRNFERNMRLMTLLDTSVFPKPENMTVTRTPFDREAFVDVCAELAFTTIIKDVDSWEKRFAA